MRLNTKTSIWVLLLSGGVMVAAGSLMNCGGNGGGESTAATTAMLRAGPISGAIFTTLEDGSRVNQNLYQAKENVYLDGGPGPGAPSTAAGLPEGNYFFQVTDPSGKDLLSTDHISCRKIHVNDHGVIDRIYAGSDYQWRSGGWEPIACQHRQGIDRDHAELGAITAQLFPYDDTSNSGGVYKVWITPVENYAGNASFVPQSRQDAVNGEGWEPGNAHGFIPASSKTDNFKVEYNGKPCYPPVLNVRKFHDANANGTQDTGELDIQGWRIGVADPLGATNNHFTTASIVASEGSWIIVEEMRPGTLQTASYLDGERLSAYPTANPAVTVAVMNACSGETHEIVFGDLGLGQVAAAKIYDRDGDGQVDAGEPPVPGWRIALTGTTVTGASIGPVVAATDPSGWAYFADLLPGTYTVMETLPSGGAWSPTGPDRRIVTIESSLVDATLSGTSVSMSFTNVCTALANFDTKGYWHNKNGLDELTDADIAYANGLAPYAVPSTYFDQGDEPFDGQFANGTPVEAAFNTSNEEVAPAGSPKAEISHFLVDSNATGDPREQLAQQMLAFVFNTRHRLDDPMTGIKLADGSLRSAGALLDEAIAVWTRGTAEEQNSMERTLDALNNTDALPYIRWTPCEVTYP